MSFAGITATVLQKNNIQFFEDGGNYGRATNIPCGSTVTRVDDSLTWAVPVKIDYVKGFQYVISEVQPTYDSIRVFKLTNTQDSDFWWVVGTPEEYYTACAACCDASPIPNLIADSLPFIAPTQYECEAAENGSYSFYFAAPILAAGRRYQVSGSVNGVALTPTAPTNLTTITALVNWLNSNWKNGNTLTWSMQPSPNGIKVVSTASGAQTIGFAAYSVPV